MTHSLRPGDELPLRTVVALNTSADEAGSIHDDAHAARMGYRGGLVPGVTLLAYLTPSLVDAFGETWPQRGRLSARFVRPAYDSETVSVHATVVRSDERPGGDDIALDCRLERPDGMTCMEAEAACLVGEAPEHEPGPWRRATPIASPRRPAPDGELPPLRPETLLVGEELSPLTYRLSLEEAVAWAEQANDDHPWYRTKSPSGRPIAQPAIFARDPIRLLRHNFARKATIHAATDLAYRNVGWVDREHTVYGRVAEVYEQRGNSYAELDTLTVDQDGREIVRDRHTSLFRLRTEAEAESG